MIYYLLFINLVSFVVYGLDKLFAIFNMRRISERCLLLFTVLGGCFGGIIAMILFHHKTRKTKFKVLAFLSVVIWLFIILGGFIYEGKI